MAKNNGMNSFLEAVKKFFGGIGRKFGKGASAVKETAIHRTAREVKFYRRMLHILPAAAGCMAALAAVGFVAALMYSKYGSFTVTINRYDNAKYALTLSEYPEFNEATARLNANAIEEINCMSTADLPDFLDDLNGDNSGKNYVSYSFYVKNVGKLTVDVDYDIFIRNATLNIERAVRVRLYTGETGSRSFVDYAHPRTQGGGPEPDTTMFYNTKSIARGQLQGLAPQEMHKFTVVIWIEGDDPDATDDVLGGQFKIDMDMNIHGVDENGETIVLETEAVES